jgi:hypothetical protein
VVLEAAAGLVGIVLASGSKAGEHLASDLLRLVASTHAIPALRAAVWRRRDDQQADAIALGLRALSCLGDRAVCDALVEQAGVPVRLAWPSVAKEEVDASSAWRDWARQALRTPSQSARSEPSQLASLPADYGEKSAASAADDDAGIVNRAIEHKRSQHFGVQSAERAMAEDAAHHGADAADAASGVFSPVAKPKSSAYADGSGDGSVFIELDIGGVADAPIAELVDALAAASGLVAVTSASVESASARAGGVDALVGRHCTGQPARLVLQLAAGETVAARLWALARQRRLGPLAIGSGSVAVTGLLLPKQRPVVERGASGLGGGAAHATGSRLLGESKEAMRAEADAEDMHARGGGLASMAGRRAAMRAKRSVAVRAATIAAPAGGTAPSHLLMDSLGTGLVAVKRAFDAAATATPRGLLLPRSRLYSVLAALSVPSALSRAEALLSDPESSLFDHAQLSFMQLVRVVVVGVTGPQGRGPLPQGIALNDPPAWLRPMLGVADPKRSPETASAPAAPAHAQPPAPQQRMADIALAAAAAQAAAGARETPPSSPARRAARTVAMLESSGSALGLTSAVTRETPLPTPERTAQDTADPAVIPGSDADLGRLTSAHAAFSSHSGSGARRLAVAAVPAALHSLGIEGIAVETAREAAAQALGGSTAALTLPQFIRVTQQIRAAKQAETVTAAAAEPARVDQPQKIEAERPPAEAPAQLDTAAARRQQREAAIRKRLKQT